MAAKEKKQVHKEKKNVQSKPRERSGHETSRGPRNKTINSAPNFLVLKPGQLWDAPQPSKMFFSIASFSGLPSLYQDGPCQQDVVWTSTKTHCPIINGQCQPRGHQIRIWIIPMIMLNCGFFICPRLVFHNLYMEKNHTTPLFRSFSSQEVVFSTHTPPFWFVSWETRHLWTSITLHS